MRRVFAVALAQVALVGLATASDPLGRTSVEAIERAESTQALPLGERVLAISDPWIGRAYLLGALGEAGGVDPQPITRYDAFDCLTFVEEILALALSPQPHRAHEVRMDLRYRDGGPYTYENRRHFMLAEWIPGTIEAGWMEDITSTLPGAEARTKTVTLDTWNGWRRRSLFDLGDARLPVGTMDFHVLPLAAAEDALHLIPDGSLVFTVRALWDHLPIAISHVGITIPAETPTMRHASAMGKKIVRDDELDWYVRHVAEYSNWPTEGLIVLKPVEAGPTLGHLATLEAERERAQINASTERPVEAAQTDSAGATNPTASLP
ncbi:MAG: DUF1460 domain-containing protein [Proteobacteria bacterium]|nr:DUF1460 domain-containing protein [Pseudomonadota bacterium]MCP4919454.1 DUF1460 domain-containing protein [Pseudomonadota bacterium]